MLRSQDQWNELERQFQAHAQNCDVALGSASEYGQECIVRGLNQANGTNCIRVDRLAR